MLVIQEQSLKKLGSDGMEINGDVINHVATTRQTQQKGKGSVYVLFSYPGVVG